VAAAAVALASAAPAEAGLHVDRFDRHRAFADLRHQIELGPRPAGSATLRELSLWLRNRLPHGRIETVRGGYRNVVGRLGPRRGKAIVLAAHYDTKDIPGFVGANDGASGVAVLLELGRQLPARLSGPSIELVFFDAEEARDDRPFDVDGARGSDQFVRYARRGGGQGSPPLEAIRAMVLLDMVGDCDLRVPREANSDPALYSAFARAASEASPEGSSAPFEGEAPGVLDDHTPFIEAGVPAVDLIDFDYGPGPTPGAWWHTRQDDLDHVCPRSLAAVGGPALAALPGLR
jgi:hypothetical protein